MTNQFITPSEVIEYLYCPRFIYFMNVLKIKQNEYKRALVNKGRDIHAMKMVRNKDYLREKIGCIAKEIDVYLSSPTLRIVGKVDEVVFLKDKTAAPLDYKYTFWENRLYKTLQIQQTLYALLIEENYKISVHNAFLVYVRSKNHLKKIPITKKMKEEAKKITKEIFDIIDINFYPKATQCKSRCSDCTYRNLCTQ